MPETKIQRRYKGENEWADISLETFIERTEGRGYYMPDTALEAIQATREIETPFAEFRLKEKTND